MKSVRHAVLGAVAAATLAAVPLTASATAYNGTDTFIGALGFVAPGLASRGFDHFLDAPSGALPGGAFSESWVFQILPPPKSGEINVNFIPNAGITGFTGQLFSLTAATCGAIGTTCSGTAGAAAVGAAILPGQTPTTYATLAPGFYRVTFTGNNILPNTSVYSGQVSVRQISEPAPLAILGIALAGIGFLRRRSA